MPYTHTTWLELQQALSARLDDNSQIYWTKEEIQIILTESLRTYGILSGFWRDRGVIPTARNIQFYDIPSLLSGDLLNYTVTDYDVIKAMQYKLLEKTTSQSVWNGTEMFDLYDLQSALQRRTNQFLQDTGIIVTHTSNLALPSPPVNRVQLPDNVIDIRRLVWVDNTGRYYRLYREDEMALSWYYLGWATNPGTPTAYSILDSRPVECQLAPAAILSGTLDMLSVNSHAALDTPNTSTTIQLPDDLMPFVEWGAIADCLALDGPARDPIRADFCEQRYQQGVEFAKLLGSVIHSRINDQPVRPSNITDIDNYQLNWQNTLGTPTDIGMSGWNLYAPFPVADGVYSVTLDVIRKAIIPQNDGDYVQIGREQINAILDQGESIALFKVGGAEFQATIRQSDDFLIEAASYNRRLSASARYIVTSKESGQDEKKVNQRSNESVGLGALNPAILAQQQNARTSNK